VEHVAGVVLLPSGDTPRRQRASFDHLVGNREQLGRDFEAECLGGHNIDDQLVLGRSR
jgi:hypothetical protein